jgi:hypothetical protein
MRSAEPVLFEYGIQTEGSDYRCHVSPIARALYVFPTAPAVALIASGRYEARPAFQDGVAGETARGYAVPIGDVPELQEIRFRHDDWWTWFEERMRPDEKGRRALDVARLAYRLDKIRLPPGRPETVLDRARQIRGEDLLVTRDAWRIQVKCDFRAGYRKDDDGYLVTTAAGGYYGTGNLYLQIAERNPYHLF